MILGNKENLKIEGRQSLHAVSPRKKRAMLENFDEEKKKKNSHQTFHKSLKFTQFSKLVSNYLVTDCRDQYY